MSHQINHLKIILPEYPRTMHLPHKPNTASGDLVATTEDTAILFNKDVTLTVEEKVDAANVGVCLYKDNFVVRNREHILRKGFQKDTPAKKQFLSLWTWVYDNRDKFEKLAKLHPEVSVYAEWLFALHGIRYDKLSTYFMPFDLYDYGRGFYLNPLLSRAYLNQSGFTIPPLLHEGCIQSWEQLEDLCNQPSIYSSLDHREGIYVKVSDGKQVIKRYKMIRSDFVQGCRWDKRKLTKNQCVKI